VDFGMACRADDPSARNWGGSLTYFAPERLRGEQPTAAAEQFAFCVSLWETILGSQPWPRERLADLVTDVGAPMRSPGADVPAALVRVLRRGLAADPRQRFENMRTLVDALAQVLTALDRRRSRWVSILLGLAAGLAVLGLERCA